MGSEHFSLTERLKKENLDQFYTLVRMHLSFVVDINTDDVDTSADKPKQFRWGFHKKTKTTESKNNGTVIKSDTNSITDDGISKLYEIIEFLSKEENLTQEGIFRRTGSLSRQQELKQLLMSGSSLGLDEGRFSVHDCASVLKGFLAELPQPLLTDVHYHTYCTLAVQYPPKAESSELKLLTALQLLLLLVPEPARGLLQRLLRLLDLVASRESSNRMCPDTLATMFTPHLLCPRKLTPESFHSDALTLAPIVSFMIRHSGSVLETPTQLATDIAAYFTARERRRIMSPDVDLDESISDRTAANTIYTFVDRTRTSAENETNPTDTALAQLYAHIHSLPDSQHKRRLVKQFNRQNGYGTPIQVQRTGKAAGSRSLGESIKKHIFNKGLLNKTPKKLGTPFQSIEERKSSVQQKLIYSTDDCLRNDVSHKNVVIKNLANQMASTESLDQDFESDSSNDSTLSEGDILNKSHKLSPKFVSEPNLSLLENRIDEDTPKTAKKRSRLFRSKILSATHLNKKYLKKNATAFRSTPTSCVSCLDDQETASENEISIPLGLKNNMNSPKSSKESLKLSKDSPKRSKDTQSPKSSNESLNNSSKNSKHKSPGKIKYGGSIEKESPTNESKKSKDKTSISSQDSPKRLNQETPKPLTPRISRRDSMRYIQKLHGFAMDDIDGQVNNQYITSTPGFSAFDLNDKCTTPYMRRTSMSPITKSTQKLCKAMQESIMTPRSRKPLIVTSEQLGQREASIIADAESSKSNDTIYQSISPNNDSDFVSSDESGNQNYSKNSNLSRSSTSFGLKARFSPKRDTSASFSPKRGSFSSSVARFSEYCGRISPKNKFSYVEDELNTTLCSSDDLTKPNFKISHEMMPFCDRKSPSLTENFREYLLSRSVLTATPVDLSLINNSGQSDKITESLLYCLDGNMPSDLTSSISNLAFDKTLNESDFDKSGSNKSDVSILKSDVSILKSDLNHKETDMSTKASNVNVKEGDLRMKEGDLRMKESDLNMKGSDLSDEQGNVCVKDNNFSVIRSDSNLKRGYFSFKEGDTNLKEDDWSLKVNDSDLKGSVLNKNDACIDRVGDLNQNVCNFDDKAETKVYMATRKSPLKCIKNYFIEKNVSPKRKRLAEVSNFEFESKKISFKKENIVSKEIDEKLKETDL